jgi:hypothetical protein
MTRRDLAWRGAGFALTAASCGVSMSAASSPITVILCALAFLGLPLMIHGKRVAQVLRAERHGHHHTAEVVHAARLRRRDRAGS